MSPTHNQSGPPGKRNIRCAKTSRSTDPGLGLLVDDLRTALPDFDWHGHDSLCRQSDDALDAVVCALMARAAHLRLTTGPPDHLSARAATEGWIHLPRDRGSLAQLIG